MTEAAPSIESIKRFPNIWEIMALAEGQPEETTKEYLKYHFTPDELNAFATAMAEGHVKLGTLREELDTIKAQYKSDITQIEGQVNSAARKFHAGYTMKDIECRLIRDFDRKEVYTVRMDQGEPELVRSRPMNKEELQRKLPLSDPETEGGGAHDGPAAEAG